MRFVAGRSAAAEKLTGHGATAEVLTEVLQRRSWPAEALRRSCWYGRYGRADQPGRLCWVSAGRGTMAKSHRENNARQAAVAGRLLAEAMAKSHRE